MGLNHQKMHCGFPVRRTKGVVLPERVALAHFREPLRGALWQISAPFAQLGKHTPGEIEPVL
jgi:hypothetical protein